MNHSILNHSDLQLFYKIYDIFGNCNDQHLENQIYRSLSVHEKQFIDSGKYNMIFSELEKNQNNESEYSKSDDDKTNNDSQYSDSDDNKSNNDSEYSESYDNISEYSKPDDNISECSKSKYNKSNNNNSKHIKKNNNKLNDNNSNETDKIINELVNENELRNKLTSNNKSINNDHVSEKRNRNKLRKLLKTDDDNIVKTKLKFDNDYFKKNHNTPIICDGKEGCGMLITKGGKHYHLISKKHLKRKAEYDRIGEIGKYQFIEKQKNRLVGRKVMY